MLREIRRWFTQAQIIPYVEELIPFQQHVKQQRHGGSGERPETRKLGVARLLEEDGQAEDEQTVPGT